MQDETIKMISNMAQNSNGLLNTKAIYSSLQEKNAHNPIMQR